MDGYLDDDEAMGLALEEARTALATGEVPIGAVALHGGRVLARAHNEREQRRDPTAHAEVLVLQRAAHELSSWRLAGVTVVVTLEPCVMCAGALVAARVDRVVFGAHDLKAGGIGSLYNVCSDPRLNHEVSVTPRVRAAECGQLLQGFFGELR